jgi:SAM-dependent methyltransferase
VARTASKSTFGAAYFDRQYGKRPWRAAGEKPILDRTRLRFLRRWIRSGNMLEIGVGHGAFTRRAATSFAVIGLDLDPHVVRRALAHTAASGVAGSALDLPIRTESMDVIMCLDVIEHLPDPGRFFAEARRVLRPAGYLHLSTPNPQSFGARRKGKNSFIYRDESHCSIHTIEEWRSKLQRAGFEEVWSGTDGLWDVPYVSWLPRALQWGVFVGATQLAWALAPAFPWSHGENFLWLGRRA